MGMFGMDSLVSGATDFGFGMAMKCGKATMGLVGNTGKMIYDGVQKARTKREVQELYRQAAETNLQNRTVYVLRGLDKQQLSLISSEPDDDDVYDYTTNSSTAALDYIWGETADPGSMIVSGGENEERVCSLVPFVHKAQAADIPIFVLHIGNNELESMIQKHSGVFESISSHGCFYDVFRGMPCDDIAYLLYNTMSDNDDAKEKNHVAESLFRALIEVLSLTGEKITIHNLAAFSLPALKSKIDALQKSGSISGDEYNEINYYFMAGSTATGAVRVFLNKLDRQSETINKKSTANSSNVKRVLNQKGVVAIDVGNSANELLISLVLNHLLMLQNQGRKFAVLLDSVPISRYEKVRELLRERPYAISSRDFVASLHGGQKDGEGLFSEITGDVSTTVLFRHNSGTTCQKWSNHIGTYKKIKVRYNVGMNNSFMDVRYSHEVSVTETDEPRVKAETLGKMPDKVACINGASGILIAGVDCS